MSKKFNYPEAFDRYLGPIDVFGMAIGIMIGWGAFVMPGTTFLPVAGPVGTLLSMIAGVIIMLVIASNFTYLMRRSPGTGGVYAYTREAFGRDHAFLASWFLCLSYLTVVFLNGTALFIVVRTVMDGSPVPGPHYTIAGNEIYITEVLISAAAFAVIGILYILNKPFLQKLFTILAFILLVGSAVIAVICIPHASENIAGAEFGIQGLDRTYSIFNLVILAPWAFVGFDAVSFDTAHFEFPMQKVKRSVFAAIIAGGLIYVGMTIAAASFVPDGYTGWGAYISDLDNLSGVISVPAFAAARAYMGSAGIVIIMIAALAAIFTGIIGAYRTVLRVLSTMAEDHILSERFMETRNSILFIMLFSIILSIFGRNTLNWFVDLTSFGAIVGYGYTSAAAYKIGKTEGNRRAKTLGMTGAVISVVLGLVQIVPRLSAIEVMGSEAFLLLALWCLLGFIFYLRTVNETALAEFTGMSTSGIVLFALLLYSSLMWIGKRLAGSLEGDAHSVLSRGGIVVMLIVFTGLAVMMYVQNLIRKKHEVIEREKIRAVESSLAKSQFLFNMSHDIRTPMNAIIGYTNLARDENDPDVLHGYLDKIDSSSIHLLNLINDILEMSRIESGQAELVYVPTDLCALYEDLRDLFMNQMEQKEMDFRINTSQVNERYVWCDKKNLTRVLMNIISNAYKFTPEGGSIIVSLWQGSTGEDGYTSYEMRVKDSGIGMSRDFIDRMFNAFERERSSTDSGIEGTGLGLAITKQIVDLMGGTIEVLTSPGSGTEIIIRIRFKPASEADMPEATADDAKADAVSADFSGRRLLLVEDNAVNMEIAVMILKQMGFEVETAVNGQKAVDMVAAAGAGHYDLVLMDIQMPVMDGYEATRAIRRMDDKKLANIPIVAMTANAFAEDIQATMDAGMQAHIAKPVDISELTRTLQEQLGE